MAEDPNTTAVSPPAIGLAAELPFHQISWPDFERLCVALARELDSEADIALYGEEDVRIVVELRRRSSGVDGQTVTGSVSWWRAGFLVAARMAWRSTAMTSVARSR